MRRVALALLAGLALTLGAPGSATSFIQRVQAWEKKHRLVLYEKRLRQAGPYRKIIVRFASLEDHPDLGRLVKECIALYSQLYHGVWCYAYDNLRALDSDLRGPAYGGTLGACWLYRAARIPSTGKIQFEKNAPVVLEVEKCPRP